MNKKRRHAAEELSSHSLQSSSAKRKKLDVAKQPSKRQPSPEVILDGVFHELRNCLQSIGMGVDLLQLDRPETVESRTIALGVERASRLLREVQEYCFPPEPYLSTRTLKEVLSDTIDVSEQERTEIRMHLHYPEELPPLRLDWLLLSRVFERVFRCARGVLPSEGGQVFVEVKVHPEQPHVVVEIRTEIHGEGELEILTNEIFSPFWSSGNYQAGLGLMLARHAMQSHNGQLTFEKTSPRQAYFSVLIDVLPETIVSMEVGQEEDHVYVE